MENSFKYWLYLHIAAGFLALVVAPVAMVVKKGGNAHRLWGKIFFWSMTVVAISALVMTFIKSTVFLALVAVFSFYLAASGYRALYRKKINSMADVKLVDWILVSVSGLFSLVLIGFGLLLLSKNVSEPFGYISIVFGFIGSRSVYTDIKSFTMAGYHIKNWLFHHMSGMVGAYIATVSAFSAVNMQFLPAVISWLWPTFVGTPLLIFWIRKYKQKKIPKES